MPAETAEDNAIHAARWDFAAAAPPSRFYAIATTMRSGSTFLSRQMWRTGQLGAPAEYFNVESVMWRFQARLQEPSIGSYVDRLFRLRTSSNGVFGFKIHYPHWPVFTLCARRPRFRPMLWIRLRRQDRLGQAVSLAVARQTDAWTADHVPRRPPQYDQQAIARALADIERGERGWDQILQQLGAVRLDVQYEELVADPARELQRIAAAMSLVLDPAISTAVPQVRRQGEEFKRQWVERFRSEAGPGRAAG